MTEQDELSRMLHDKVQAFDVRPSDVPQVEARASRIRARRRVAAVSAVAAAVAAAAVPTTLALRTDEGRVQPVQPTPSTSTRKAAPTPTTLEGIRQGEAPHIGWLLGDTVHLPSGATMNIQAHGTVDAPDEVWVKFATFQGGVVLGSADGAGPTLAVAGPDGTLTSEGVGAGPVVSADRSRTAWWTGTTKSGAFVSGPTDGTGGVDTTLPTPAGARPQLVGLLDDQIVYKVDFDTGGAAVTCGQSCTITLSGMSVLAAANEPKRLVTGYRSDGCTGVFRVPDLAGITSSRSVPVKSLWPCVHEIPDSFSPDGSKVLLLHQAEDGTLDAVTVRDSASGRRLMRYAPPLGWTPPTAAPVVGPTVWEDDSHVLVEVYSAAEDAWTVLRVGTDGSVERATEMTPGDETRSPFAFAVQP